MERKIINKLDKNVKQQNRLYQKTHKLQHSMHLVNEDNENETQNLFFQSKY